MSRLEDFNQVYTDAPRSPVSDEPFVFLSVDYDEPDPKTYRGVNVSVSRGTTRREERLFATLAEAEVFAQKIGGHKAYSSSFDNFKADLKRHRPTPTDTGGR